MARSTQTKNKYHNAVNGNLAFDFDYQERQERREERRRAPQENPIQRPVKKAEVVRREETVRRVRERQKISPLTAFGAVALMAVIVVVLMSYARLTTLSNEVVAMQRQLSGLQDENVVLLARHEQTFDLAAVKQAAAEAGMYKPSASQIYYIDLSAPDSVVIYDQPGTSVLSRVFASFGQGVFSVVEYFS